MPFRKKIYHSAALPAPSLSRKAVPKRNVSFSHEIRPSKKMNACPKKEFCSRLSASSVSGRASAHQKNNHTRRNKAISDLANGHTLNLTRMSQRSRLLATEPHRRPQIVDRPKIDRTGQLGRSVDSGRRSTGGRLFVKSSMCPSIS